MADWAHYYRFLLVELRLRYILNRRRLCDERSSRVDAAHFPGLYVDTIERIGQSRDFVFQVLSWLFYALHPLTIDELRQAIAVRVGDTRIEEEYLDFPDFVVEQCKGTFLEPVSSILHISQYKQINGISMLSVVDLATTCLTYLSFDTILK